MIYLLVVLSTSPFYANVNHAFVSKVHCETTALEMKKEYKDKTFICVEAYLFK